MEINTLKKEASAVMEKTLESFNNELKKIRTGKAQVSMLDTIRVDYYGTPSPLSQVASISCPDPRSFLISPWEKSLLKEVEQAIVKSSIGMAPLNDGKVIRLKLPELTEERRKEIVKQVHKIQEETRIGIRQVRRQFNESIKEAEKKKEISEDGQRAFNDSVQEITNSYIAKVDEVGKQKEKSILEI